MNILQKLQKIIDGGKTDGFSVDQIQKEIQDYEVNLKE